MLDAENATRWPHAEIARHLHEDHEIPGWWAQMVTVGYERIRGLRDVGQRRGGSYEANKSKTVPVPVEALFAAFDDPEKRARWLPGIELVIRKSTPYKSVRMRWSDDAPVNAYFTAKGERKSQVQVQHEKLPDKDSAEWAKEFWGERLQALSELLL